MKALAVILLSFLMTGCIKNRMYVAPNTGDLVKLDFKSFSKKPFVQTISFFEDDYDCYDAGYLSVFSPDEPKKAMLFKRRDNYTIKYSQSQPKRVGRHDYVSSCFWMITFPVKKDHSYSFVTDHDDVDNKCYLSVMEKSDQDGENNMKWSVVEFVNRDPVTPILNAGPWCKADERFKGSSSLPVPRGSEKK